MKRVLVLGAVLCVTAASTPASSCDSTGAFGIKFGQQAKSKRETVRQTKAAIVYVVSSPEPDPRFDQYQVNVNSRTGEIFQIMGIKRITPKPTSTEFRLSQEEKDAASQRAYDFATSYIASLPESLQSMLVDEYGSGSWKGMVSEDVEMRVIGNDHWEVSVICQDVRKAGVSLKGVW